MAPMAAKDPSRRLAGVGPAKKKQRTGKRPLRFASFLAPNMLPVYQFIVQRIGSRLRCAVELLTSSDYQLMASDLAGAFVCGLAYVELSHRPDLSLVPMVAPVLEGKRYGGKPVYFSDVIVRRDRWFRSFADLRGCSWAYNEPHSHSGYGIIRYELARRRQSWDFFGKVVQAGSHERSIRLVRSGAVDASAIDSQVLAVALRDDPQLAAQLRIIDSFGPSTIQPLLVARHLPEPVRAELLSVLLEMGEDPVARAALAQGFIRRFVPVSDSCYDDIRQMLQEGQAAGSAGTWTPGTPTLPRAPLPGATRKRGRARPCPIRGN